MKEDKMLFNNKETETGFSKLTERMFYVVAFIKYYVKAKYDIDIVLTETIRTQQGQDTIYLNASDPKIVEKYKNTPWQSVHQFGRGVDVSVLKPIKWSLAMIKDVEETANRIFYSNKYQTAKWHDVGAGDHLHFQVPDSRPKQPEEV